VVNGTAGETLLSTYSPERRAATLEVFREASKSTNYMTPPSRGYRLMRDASLSLSLSQDWAGDLANPRQSAPYDYVDSPLNSWPDEDAAFESGPRCGAPAISMKLTAGGYLTDLLGPRLTAICFTGAASDDATIAALNDCGQTVDVIQIDPAAEPALAKAYGAQAGTLYLLRPDSHVAARARTAPPPEAIARAIARIRGEF